MSFKSFVQSFFKAHEAEIAVVEHDALVVAEKAGETAAVAVLSGQAPAVAVVAAEAVAKTAVLNEIKPTA